ncbi:MAG: anti-sigma factor, partial [Leptothrix sp. (in: Bacteria)]|nr:anti-sigma factor [Leptothrix sp. (in: b-proteobacteria)]
SSAPGESAAVAASPRFVQEAVVAHAVYVPEARHPVEVTASDESHLIQWLSRRLGAPLKAPSLERFGYRLLGGRLLPGEGVPRAQFMYENPQGGRVTLYVAVFEPGQAPDSTSFRSVRRGDEESFYWIEDRFGYALNAKASGRDLQALAREVYAQLQR